MNVLASVKQTETVTLQSYRERLSVRDGYLRTGMHFTAIGMPPCYVPELSDTVYTGNDLLSLCNGQEEIAEELFYEMDWPSPSMLINEWETDGEISTCARCGKLLLADEEYSCPYCGSSIERI